MIRFETYRNGHYQRVCDFLIKLNEENHYHDNWNWARFEWMHEHSLTKKELLGSMGLWFDGERVIGAALIDMFFGEAFVGVLRDYRDFHAEILRYAFDNLKDENGLGIAICDDDREGIREAIEQGFAKAEGEETVCAISLDREFSVVVPEGFHVETFDAQEHPREIEWLAWQGFDHGDDHEEFLSQYKEPTGKRPHFNPNLCIVVKNDRGELVATASAWYDPRTDYAYVEPVCVIPSCRKMGLGKAAVITALNHARETGAKSATVISDQEFYLRLGFKKRNHYTFYWRKPR